MHVFHLVGLTTVIHYVRRETPLRIICNVEVPSLKCHHFEYDRTSKEKKKTHCFCWNRFKFLGFGVIGVYFFLSPTNWKTRHAGMLSYFVQFHAIVLYIMVNECVSSTNAHIPYLGEWPTTTNFRFQWKSVKIHSSVFYTERQLRWVGEGGRLSTTD